MKPNRSFLNALKWAYLGNWGDKAFAALFTFILAGVLGPKEFGIVSISIIYINFLQLFLDQGLATALIQRKNLEPEHLDAVFWSNLGFSLFLVVLSLGLAHSWAEANHAPKAVLIIPILSISIVLESLSLVQVSILNREMDFRSLTIRSNTSTIVSGIVGITMAFAGFGIWALVTQQLLRDAVALVLLWKMSSWRPRISFSWPHLKELLGFSIPNFVAKLGIFVDGQATSVAFGIYFGPKAVGLYRLAEKVSGSVITMAMSAAQSVSLPEFARHQNDRLKLRDAALTCIRLAATVTVPALAGLAVVSSQLMAVVGPEWLAATNVLKVLCVFGAIMIFTFFTGPLLQALGRTTALAILEWSRTLVGLLFLVIAAHLVRDSSEAWQILGIPLARLANGVCVIAPLYLYFFVRLCRLQVRDLVRAIMPSAITAGAIIAAVMLFQATGLLEGNRPMIRLTVQVLIGGISGLPVLLSLDQHLREVVYNMLRKVSPQWQKKFGPPWDSNVIPIPLLDPVGSSPKIKATSGLKNLSSLVESPGRLKSVFVPVWHLNPYHANLSYALSVANVDVWCPPSLKTAYEDVKVGVKSMDLLHLHSLPYLGLRPGDLMRYLRFFWRVNRILDRNIPVIWTVHEIDNHDSNYRRTESLLMRFLSRRVDAIIVHGNTAKQLVAASLGAPESRISVIMHGNYINTYKKDIARETARATLNLESGNLVLLFFGHLRPYKGIPEMVKAFRNIDDANARLVIAGMPIDKAMKTEIANSVAGDYRIKFLPGRVDEDQVQVYMNACDLVVLPYRRILTSGAAVLAMSFGKACIAPRAGCVTDVMDDNGTIFFDPLKDGDLDRALREAIYSQSKLAEMGAYNLNKARQWDWETIGRQTAAVYQQCIAARKTSRESKLTR
ncbi:MAG TPA: oligosaccharide flippase family protein [Lacunisphaera sp.]